MQNLQKVLDDVGTKLDKLEELEDENPPPETQLERQPQLPGQKRPVINDPEIRADGGNSSPTSNISGSLPRIITESPVSAFTRSADHVVVEVKPDDSSAIQDSSGRDRPPMEPVLEPEPVASSIATGAPGGVDSTQMTEAWEKVWKRLRSLDEAKVKDYKEDIDTLLVFAGLFSAVVTAFVIAYYVALQPNSNDTSSFLLFHISTQLSLAFAIGSTALDPSQLQLPSFPFQAPAQVVRVNILWFTSLIFALVTASGGILVKQWLREYMAMDDMKPDQRCRVRYIRAIHLAQWRVYEIASFLPLLLQASVILFFVGLSDFARSINAVLGWTITAFIIVYLVLFTAATLAPLVSVYCPYKTPMLKSLLQYPRYIFWKIALWRFRQWPRSAT